MRNLQEQVKKAFCYQKLFWPFTVWINCSSDLNFFFNSRPSASNFKSFSQSLEQFFLKVGQNNFGNKFYFFFQMIGTREIKPNFHRVFLISVEKCNKICNVYSNGYGRCSIDLDHTIKKINFMTNSAFPEKTKITQIICRLF